MFGRVRSLTGRVGRRSGKARNRKVSETGPTRGRFLRHFLSAKPDSLIFAPHYPVLFVFYVVVWASERSGSWAVRSALLHGHGNVRMCLDRVVKPIHALPSCVYGFASMTASGRVRFSNVKDGSKLEPVGGRENLCSLRVTGTARWVTRGDRCADLDCPTEKEPTQRATGAK